MTLHHVSPDSCRFIVVGSRGGALRWAARANLALREWGFVEQDLAVLLVFERMTPEAQGAAAPLREWERPHE